MPNRKLPLGAGLVGRCCSEFGPLVINSGGKLIVVDTGNGPGAYASSKGNVGQFTTNMAAAASIRNPSTWW